MGTGALGAVGRTPSVSSAGVSEGALTIAGGEFRATGRGAPSSAYGGFAALWAFVLPLAASPALFFPTFTPKYAVMLLAGAVGLVPLATTAARGPVRWASRFALTFLLVALVSALLSRAPNIGFFGLQGWGTGWLFWCSCAGAFGIGAMLRRRDGSWLFYGLLGGALGNVIVVIGQVVFHPSSGVFAGYAGGTQADGLLGNPVHVEALFAGTLAMLAIPFCESPRRWWWAIVALGAGLELTGERLAIPLLLLIFAVMVIRRRGRGASYSLLVVLGYGLAYAGGATGLRHRVASGTAETTFGLRLQLWHTALHAIALHPLVGGGPGELLGTIAPLVSSNFAHNLTGDRLFTDAHNWIVEVVITTGLLGLAAFAAWLVFAVRIARGPFLAFAAGVLAIELAEPMNQGVTPLAFLAIGAAVAAGLGRLSAIGEGARSPALAVEQEQALLGVGGGAGVAQAPALVADGAVETVETKPRRRHSPRRLSAAVVTTCAVLVALAIGGTMVAGGYFYTQARTSTFNTSNPSRANTLLPYWPESAVVVAFDVWQYRGSITHDPAERRADLREAVHWWRVALKRDPGDPTPWASIAILDSLTGSRAGAAKAYEAALADYPWMTAALSGYAQLEESEHHWRSALSLYHRLSEVRALEPGELRNVSEARRALART